MNLLKRIAYILGIIALALFVSPLVSLGFAVIVSIFFFPLFYEIMILGIIFDVMEMSTFSVIGITLPLYTSIVLILSGVLYFIHKRLMIYAE